MADILVVEDEEDLRELLASHLEGEGHQVTEAKNGKEALDLYPSVNPDIVISDINMPIMDGYELIGKLQESYPEFDETPFFFLSALSDSQDQVKGLSLGIDEYLCKPVDYDVLTVRLNLALQRKEKIKNKINDALTSSTPVKSIDKAPPAASDSSSDSSSRPSRERSASLNLLETKKSKLNRNEQEKILSLSSLEGLRSTKLINKIGRNVKISRLSLSKDNFTSVDKIMKSSEFDVNFSLKVNDNFFKSVNKLFKRDKFCDEKAVIIPSLFQHLCHDEIMSEYIKNLNEIQSNYNISIISEVINLPENDDTYIDVLKNLANRGQIQVVEIRNKSQIDGIDIKSMCIGAVSMDYNFAIKQNKNDMAKLRKILNSYDVNLYIKEIPKGGIINAQSFKADLLSSLM